jgi:hypothetical protein
LDAIVKRLAEEMGFEVVVVKEPVKRKMPFYEKIKVLVPTREYTWESYHSDVNQTNLTSTLAKEIAENLDLCGQPQTFDLFEKSGKRATIALRHGNHWHTYQSLIYLRKELLDRYLGETENELVWAIWGERGSMTEDMPGADDDRVRYKVFQQIIRYEP